MRFFPSTQSLKVGGFPNLGVSETLFGEVYHGRGLLWDIPAGEGLLNLEGKWEKRRWRETFCQSWSCPVPTRTHLCPEFKAGRGQMLRAVLWHGGGKSRTPTICQGSPRPKEKTKHFQSVSEG